MHKSSCFNKFFWLKFLSYPLNGQIWCIATNNLPTKVNSRKFMTFENEVLHLVLHCDLTRHWFFWLWGLGMIHLPLCHRVNFSLKFSVYDGPSPWLSLSQHWAWSTFLCVTESIFHSNFLYMMALVPDSVLANTTHTHTHTYTHTL